MVPLAEGRAMAAFAFTEPNAGSDAGQRPDPQRNRAPMARLYSQRRKTVDHQRRYRQRADRDGTHTRRRTDPDGKITAFLVTPDMPGFEVLDARHGESGYSRDGHGPIKFTNMFVPTREHLGPHRQRFAGRLDGVGLWPHDVRRTVAPGRRNTASSG